MQSPEACLHSSLNGILEIYFHATVFGGGDLRLPCACVRLHKFSIHLPAQRQKPIMLRVFLMGIDQSSHHDCIPT
ncbi:unnamed protein product [Coffea canephora]|uniref:Uncharacterized protein n=1 Tax=Coffea canephora TaxID=49390 RepID=A0A068UPW9_COFCA|nr:unnamed protein product [Coffea canephora]